MKIVKAMKTIARLQGEIKEIKKRISSSLNTAEENDFDEEYKELEKKLSEKISQMMTLKTRIMHTNVANNMFSKIILLGELKSNIDFLRELEPKIGTVVEHYSDTNRKYKSQMSIQEKNKAIETCQEAINSLTDELDEFNAKTDLLG